MNKSLLPELAASARTAVALIAAVLPALSGSLHAAIVTWTGPASGEQLWNNPANWSTGAVPTANDDVVLDVPGASLTAVIGEPQTVRSLLSRATVWLQGGRSGNQAYLTVMTNSANYGAIVLQSTNGTYICGLFGGMLTNGPTGVIECRVGSGGARHLTGTVINQGLLLSSSGVWSGDGLALLNLGEIQVHGTVRWGSSDGSKTLEHAGGRIVSTNGVMSYGGGLFRWTGGTIDGAVYALDGPVDIAASAPDSTLRVAGQSARLLAHRSTAAELWVNGNGNLGVHAYLTCASNALNAGRIRLEATDSTYNCGLFGGVLTNAPTGVIECRAGTGGSRHLTGTVINQGLLLSSSGVWSGDGLALLNLGEIHVHGTIGWGSSDGSKTLEHAGGRIVSTNGLMSYSGSLFRWTGGTIDGAVYALNGPVDIAASAPASTLRVAGQSARLLAHRSTAAELWVNGNINLGHAYLTCASNALNAGRIRLEATDSTYNCGLFGGVLTNAPTGVIECRAGTGGSRHLAGTVINQGLLLSSSGVWSGDSLALLNLGEIQVHGTVRWGSSDGSKTLEHAGGRIVSTNGVMSYGGGLFRWTGGTIDGAVYALDGPVDIAASAPDSTLRVAGQSARLLAHRSTAAELWVNGNGNLGVHAYLTCASNALNAGRIRLEATDSTYNCGLFGGVLTNAPTGVIECRAGTGGSRHLTGTVINQGLLLSSSGVWSGDGLALLNLGEIHVHGTIGWGSSDGSKTLEHAGGRIVSTNGLMSYSGSLFRWTGGTIDGAVYALNGPVDIAASAPASTLRVAGQSARLLAHRSTAAELWVNGNINLGHAYLTCASNALNAGRIRLEATDSTYNCGLFGDVLTNAPTGVIECHAGTGGNRYLQFALENQGVLRTSAGVPLGVSGSRHRNAGRIEVTGATLRVAGDSLLNTTAGLITGTGALDVRNVVFENAGTVSPGGSPGILTFLGSYNQSASGRLQVEIGGLTSGVQYDRLEVQGLATLDGSLTVETTNSFVPAPGDTFRALTASGGLVGQFASYSNLQVHPARFLLPTYSANALDLLTLNATNAATNVIAPSIAGQPADRNAPPGGAATFFVTVNGTSPFTYQWRFNGSPLPGATGGTLTLTNVQPAQAGGYSVVVANSVGSVTSAVAILTVQGTDLVWLWDGGGDGANWSDPRNWNVDRAPVSGARVSIDVTNNPVIRVENMNLTLTSLNSQDSLLFSGGSLTLTNGPSSITSHSVFNNQFSLTLQGSNAVAAFDAVTNIDTASLYASGGAVLALPGVRTFDWACTQSDWRATGAGSRIELPGLTSLPARWCTWLYVRALAGGQINLSNVVTVADAAFDVLAQGSNSVVNLSGWSTYGGTAAHYAPLEAQDGGQILMPRMEDGERLRVTVRRGGSISTAQLQRLQSATADAATLNLSAVTNLADGGSLTLLNGATADVSRLTRIGPGGAIDLGSGASVDLSGITNIDATSLYARGGAVLALPGVRTFDWACTQSDWQAIGAGSRIELPGLTNLPAPWCTWLYVRAQAGGQINLSNVVTIADAPFDALAQGSNSVVNLSGWSTYGGTAGHYAPLEAQDGGRILMPRLEDGERLRVTVRRGGSISTAQLRRLQSATADAASLDLSNVTNLVSGGGLTLENGGSVDVGHLTNIDGVNLYASGGAVLTLPGVQNFTWGCTALYWQASGAGSRIELPGLTNLPAHWCNWLYVRALAGGQVDLSNVVSVADAPFDVLAEGNGSVVNLSRWTSWFGTSDHYLPLEARNGGTILVPRLQTAWRIRFTCGPGGLLALPSLRQMLKGRITIDGRLLTLPVLTDHTGTTFTYQNGGSILFPPAADLRVASVSGPLAANAGTLVPVVWAVTNASTNAVTVPRRDAVWLSTDVSIGNDQLLASFAVPDGLAAGGTQSVTNYILLPPGLSDSRWLVVQADFGLDVFEGTAETNNIAIGRQPVSVSSADLVVSGSLSISSAFGTAGAPFTVEWIILNQGASPASAAWNDEVRLAYGGFTQTLASVAAPATLAAGTSYTSRATVTLPLSASFPCGQSLTLLVAADGNGFQPESNENNNAAFTTITLNCPPLPDLTPALLAAPSQVLPGETADIIWAVTNRGVATAISGWLFEIRSGPGNEALTNELAGSLSLLTSAATNALAPGASLVLTQQVVIPANFPAGPVRFAVRVDADDSLVESIETNNVAQATNVTLVPAALTFFETDREVREDAGTFTVLLMRNGNLNEPLDVEFNSAGGRLAATPVVMAPGAASAPVTVRVIPDSMDYSDAEKLLFLTTTNGSYNTESFLSILIRNVDRPALTLALATNAAAEGTTVAGTVSRTGPTNEPVTVSFFSSTPSQVFPPASITLPVGVRWTNVTWQVVDDSLIEAEQTYTLGAQASGLLAATALLDVPANDVPELALAFEPAIVSEGAGNNATRLVVRRTAATSRSATVRLSVMSSELRWPARMVIPANATVASAPLGVVDNGSVDEPPTRTIIIEAVALVSGTELAVGPAVQAQLTVTDDDGPTLAVELSGDVAREGRNPALTGVVRRNNGTSGNLTVTVTNSNPQAVATPALVVISNGASSAMFTVATTQDNQPSADVSVRIGATAAGFTAGAAEFILTDDDLPNLRVTAINPPGEAFVGDQPQVTFAVTNSGVWPVTNGFRQRVYLSRDAVVGDDLYVRDLDYTLPAGELAPGAGFSQTFSLSPLLEAGDYWVVVETDTDDAAREVDELDNVTVSAGAIQVAPSFDATVAVAGTSRVFPAGSDVPLTGSVTMRNGGSPTGQRVTVEVTVGMFQRLLTVEVTRADGKFDTVFQPLPNEAGRYSVAAFRAGEHTAPPQDSFTFVGAVFRPGSLSLLLTEGQTLRGTVVLTNLSDVDVAGLSAGWSNAAPNISATLMLSANTLAAEGTVTLALEFTPTSLTPATGVGELVVTGDYGVSVALPIGYRVAPLRPRLEVTVPEVVSGMVRGQSRVVEFEVVNRGGVSSGPVNVVLPGVPWLTLGVPNPLPSLAPGATNRVSLVLLPANDLPLGVYSGQLVVEAGGAGLAVPYQFTVLSEARGDLLVIAEDEFTFFAEGHPRVGNARVVLRDRNTGQVVTNGFTLSNGRRLFTNLVEAVHDVEVTADQHGAFRGSVLVAPGTTTEVAAFLPRQTVTINWDVQPTEVPDRYNITISSTFESVVPAPVITVTPSMTDLNQLGSSGYIELAITNHGLIAAEDLELLLPDHPCWSFTGPPQAPTFQPPLPQFPVALNPGLTLGRLGPQRSIRVTIYAWRRPGDCCTAPTILNGNLRWGLTIFEHYYTYATPYYFTYYPLNCPGGNSGGGEGGSGVPGPGDIPGVTLQTPVQITRGCTECPVQVSLQLQQSAALTREAFLSTLRVGNRAAGSLRDVETEIRFRTDDGREASQFFILRERTIEGFVGNDGDDLPAGATGVSTWTWLPTIDAAPTNATRYRIGGVLRYQPDGGPRVEMPLTDVTITVHPSPQLTLRYFHQRDVFSDDPFTPEAEPAVPYSLAVQVLNTGYGTAGNFRITSGEPRIVRNDNDLLIDFRLVGAEVEGLPTASRLTAEFGDVGPRTNRIGRWLLTSSLQGLFVDYQASFEHVDAIAGRPTSLITGVEIHEMIHPVFGDGDGRLDFLVNDRPDLEALPDTVFLSDGTVHPVQVAREAFAEPLPLPLIGTRLIPLGFPARGYAYLRLRDSRNASGPQSYRLVAVQRLDGSYLPADNFWQTDRTFPGRRLRAVRENLVHIFDRADLNPSGNYTLHYSRSPDTAAPVTQVAPLPAQSTAQIPVTWIGADETGGSGLARFDIYVSRDDGPLSAGVESDGWKREREHGW